MIIYTYVQREIFRTGLIWYKLIISEATNCIPNFQLGIYEYIVRNNDIPPKMKILGEDVYKPYDLFSDPDTLFLLHMYYPKCYVSWFEKYIFLN